MEIYKYKNFVEIYEAKKPNSVQQFFNKMTTVGQAGEIGGKIASSLTQDKKGFFAKMFGKVGKFTTKWFGNLFNLGSVLSNIFNSFAGVQNKDDVDGVVKDSKAKLFDIIDTIKGKRMEELDDEAKNAKNESIDIDIIDEALVIEAYDNIYEMVDYISEASNYDEELIEQLEYIVEYLEELKDNYISI